MIQTEGIFAGGEKLDTVLARQETLIEDIKTALEGKAAPSVEFGWFSCSVVIMNNGWFKYPFLIGMTWEEWLNTPCNMDVGVPYFDTYTEIGNMYASENYVMVYSNGYAQAVYVSTDGTESGRVVLTDKILNETTYSFYATSSGMPGMPV